VPSIRSVRSGSSSSSSENNSKSGSASTVFVPPLDTIPDLPSSTSSVSSRSSVAGGLAVPSPASLDDAGFHHLRASDDAAISSEGILYPLERSGSKVIAPSRSSSLRRTSSLADLDAEFASALSRSTPGSTGKPVTVSSGPSSTQDVFVSPPPSAGKITKAGSAAKSSSSDTDSGAYLTPPSRISARTTPTSSYYSLPLTPLRPRTDSRLGAGNTHGPRSSPSLSSGSAQAIVTSTLSLRGSRSASLLGDSHDGDNSDANSTSSFTPSSVSNTPPGTKRGLLAPESPNSKNRTGSSLSRSPGVRRRTPRKTSSRATSSSSAGTDFQTPVEGSDKENEGGTELYDTATRLQSGPSTPTERSYRSAGALPSTPTAHRTRTPSYDSIGYDVCPSSDLSEFTPLSSRSEVSGAMSDAESATGAPGTAGSTADIFLSPTARTLAPSSTTFTTASVTPSSTEYRSLSTCESTEYASVASCPSSTNYQTAELCTEYETAELCSSGPSTQYETAEVCPPSTKSPSTTLPSSSLPAPSRPSTRSPSVSSLTTSSSLPPPNLPSTRSLIVSSLTTSSPATVTSVVVPPSTPHDVEDEESDGVSAGPSSKPPSIIGTIPSLPESTPRFVPSTRFSPASRPPSIVESEPVPVSHTEFESTVAPPSSVISSNSTTLSSVTPTTSSSSSLVPPLSSSSLTPPTPSSSVPSIRESLYEESSGTYESSLLLPSPSLHSMALHEGVDVSFDTSFLRPSDSMEASDSRLQIAAVTPPPLTPPPMTPSPVTPPLTSPHSSVSTMTRTPSSVSSISMRSSMIGPDTESLYYAELPSSADPSTSVSSLSSESSVTPDSTVSNRSLTPTSPPVSVSSDLFSLQCHSVDWAVQSTPLSTPLPFSTPSTPAPRSYTATPEATFSVSISTPYSNAPSIASQLETVPSLDGGASDLAAPPPSEILTHDVNRLLRYLHDVDATRNEQNVDMASHLDRIEALLRDLAASLKAKYDKPPPVPTKDISVGRSSVTRTPTPIPQGSASPSGPSVRSLSPPPERLPSPSSLLTSISWLSSHHSDDWELMSAEVAKHLPSSSSSDTTSITASTPSPALIPASLPPPVPAVSPALSVETVRPGLTLMDLRGMIDDVLTEVAVLRNGQLETQNMLKDIRQETTEPQSETSEQRRCKAMIGRTEDMLRQILERLSSETHVSASSEYSEVQDQSGLIDLMTRLLRPAPPPASLTVHAPSPVPPAPSVSDLFPDIGVVSAPSFPIPLEPLPTIRRPRTRQRPRSVTPPVLIPRASTAPVPSSDGEYRGVPPFRPPESSIAELTPILRRSRALHDTPSRTERPLPDLPTRRTSSDRLDMERFVRADRERRRVDAPNGFFMPAGQPAQQPAVSLFC
jgi:hypothetical protein